MRRHVIAFTGSGISRESGIPTFEDMGDLRTKLSRDFATEHPEEYRAVISEMKDKVRDAQPNDAHIALAEYNIPIITMNIDGLHTKAGSKDVIEVHGVLPDDSELDYCDELYNKPVLYGDPAPMYSKAFMKIDSMEKNDILLVVGASTYSSVSNDIRYIAHSYGIEIIEIQDNASTKVRETLKELFDGEN